MKKLSYFLFLALFSCGGNENSESSNSNILEDLTFSVDTVMIDPGEELLVISSGYQLKSSSSFSEDNRFLYIFNHQDHVIAKVDLNELKLRDFFSFEKEGPNGTGPYVQNQQVLPEEQFLITGYQLAGVFERTGNKVQNFNLNTEEFSGLDENTPFGNQLILASGANWLFSLSGLFNQGGKDLVKLSPSEKTGKLIDLSGLDIADNYFVALHSDQGSMFSVPQFNLQEINGKLYITTEVTSSLYQYDYQNDLLHLVTFDHQIVPPAKTGKLKKEVTSRDEFNDEMLKSSSQVSFEKLLWDEKTNRFFRLGRKVLLDDPSDANSYSFEYYLFVYDKELNLLGEKYLDGVTDQLAFYFLKEGKLWSYVNVEDELGFAVFTFDF
ncbi:hypothetical protein FHS59_002055 [Algoriphagus iocasae]|uniref:DUF4221 domain-containing protein n=1 Tax=Algoriphagus iocasae TaxID=1836499 RepID=A0A841MLQ5_9BACT|nr:DUF4221 domain-containing protein [Algoriphagus iocasae]MBB6326427.1 hypothetical protein [Algoriphagus iocasae]